MSLPPAKPVIEFPSWWVQFLARLGSWETCSEGYIAPPAAWLAIHPATALACSKAEGGVLTRAASTNWLSGTDQLQSWMSTAIQMAQASSEHKLELVVRGRTCSDWSSTAMTPAEFWPALTHQQQMSELSIRSKDQWITTELIQKFLQVFVPPEWSHTQRVALHAGWLEVLGFSDESHAVSQSVEGQGQPPHGDFWHAIHHRREPDPGNAGYWFRRVSRHPLLRELNDLLPMANEAFLGSNARFIANSWNGSTLLNSWEEIADDDQPGQRYRRFLQWLEMAALTTCIATSRPGWSS